MSRLIGACVCAALSALILIVAVPTAIKVGTDDVIDTPAETLHGGQAIVFNENLVPFSRATAFLHVSSDSPLFVGTANGVDVDDYVADTSYQLITGVDFPGDFTHRLVSGSTALGGDPGALDWWTSKRTGRSTTVRFSPTDHPQYIVVRAPSGAKSIDASVRMGLHTDGVFGYCLIGFGLALLLLVLAAALFLWWRSTRLPPARPLGRTPARPRSDTLPDDVRPHRDARAARKTMLRGAAVAGTVLIAASGCAAPVHPRAVQPVEPTKIAMPRSAAPAFMKSYTKALDASYRHDLHGLSDIQGEPQLARTRALAITNGSGADESGDRLHAPAYSSVTVAAPRLSEYPLWFIARAEDGGPDYLLVERATSTSPWRVVQTVHSGKKLPALIGRRDGSAPLASTKQQRQLASSARSVAHFLQTGAKPDDGTHVGADGLDEYRSYVGRLRNKKSGFTSVTPKCSVRGDMTRHAVKTKGSVTALAEIRCTLTVSVPSSFSLDLGSSIEALLGAAGHESDGRAHSIEVTSSHPIVLSRSSDGSTDVVGTDWYLIGADSK